ncbi:hypothetical protein [Spirosoma validum]|uniref:hypothetical protein n=1 Tax=Spirosoma validum TaxID=2771355 RepID=UPI001CC2A0F4|nr:hypothetical protein [Spirosoma validum]
MKDNDPQADIISKTLDNELTRLTHQLAFVREGDYQAISAVMLGDLSYLTIQAQLDRTVIGIDLRSEAGWQRIEEAVKAIYKAINQFAMNSPKTQFSLRKESLAASDC